MHDPLINILVPTHDPDPHLLQKALNSILYQKEQRFTVFIRDNASLSPVPRILAPYLTDRRFVFTRSEERKSIGNSWNACLSQGKAPFIQYLFQDDYWYPTYLSSLLSIFQKNPHVGFVTAHHEYQCDEDLNIQSLYNDLHKQRKNLLSPGVHQGSVFLQSWIQAELHPNLIGEPSFVMMRRSLMEKIGIFREDMSQSLDVEYWLRALQLTDWYFIQQDLGIFRVHKNSASMRNSSGGTGLYDRLTCFEHLLSSLPQGTPLYQEALSARKRAITRMAAKFFKRMRVKKDIPLHSSRSLWTFAFHHPIVMCQAILKAFLQH